MAILERIDSATTDHPDRWMDILHEGQLQEFLKRNRLVSVYSRLHFLFGQEAFLSGYGQMIEEGVEVTLHLTLPPEEQFRRYHRGHRADVRKLRRRGFVCKEVGPECLDEFMDVFYSTLDRAGARRIFYASKSHFEYLMSEMKDHIHLFACKDGEKVACAGFVTECKGRIAAYRAGCSNEYRGSGVSKLLYDHVRLWGNSIGAGIFELGGGVDGARDSLYRFKMDFGGQEHVYSTWRYVANREVYDDLCRQAFVQAGTRPDDAYFPEYRSPSLKLG